MGIFRATVLEARVNYKGHDILFTNSWSLVPLRAKSTLKVDGVEVAKSTEITHPNPHEPLLSVENISPNLGSIDVFCIGVLKVKASIVVNGEVVHQDKIDALDRMQAKVFDS